MALTQRDDDVRGTVLRLDHPTMQARLDLLNMKPAERAIIDSRGSDGMDPA